MASPETAHSTACCLFSKQLLRYLHKFFKYKFEVHRVSKITFSFNQTTVLLGPGAGTWFQALSHFPS